MKPVLILIPAAFLWAAAVEIPASKVGNFVPLPEAVSSPANPTTPEKVALGRMLYYDARLSLSQKVSCNSCHDLAKYGVDNRSTSPGHKGQLGGRNSPTVYNAAGHFAQFWDGRASDVEAQASGPMMNPVEMAATKEHVLAVLNSIPDYVSLFKKAFPGDSDPVSLDNAAKAIAAFERKLTTPARWDKYLKGEKIALTDDEKAGFLKFVDAGCPACHNGAYVGGQSFQKLGIAKAWKDSSDAGRQKVTHQGGDKLFFKVPSLRNINKTGPYFHNGRVSTLDEAIRLMSDYQLGRPLTPADVKSIMIWLNTLTGDIPADYVKEPALPPSSDKTPKPVS